MILDKMSLLSDDQDLSQAAGSYYSDIMKLDAAARTTSVDAPSGVVHDPGKSAFNQFLCQVTETFTSGGAATLTVSLETSTDEAFTSPVTLVSSKTFALAELVAGTHLLPESIPYGCLAFLRVKYVIGTATTTAGTATAGFVLGLQSN